MKVLLDECLPKPLKRAFLDHSVSTVPEMGWAGKTNGELLKLAKDKFDVFVTVDQNLQYQQNLEESGIAIILVSIENNRSESFKPLLPKIQQSLQTISRGRLVRIKD